MPPLKVNMRTLAWSSVACMRTGGMWSSVCSLVFRAWFQVQDLGCAPPPPPGMFRCLPKSEIRTSMSSRAQASGEGGTND